MANKKESHTGVRNELLFCFHCGRSYDMHLPQPATMAAAMMKQFDKDHAKCTKTWVEPVNIGAPANTEYMNAQWWLKQGEHGRSSQTIFTALYGVSPWRGQPPYHPADPDDFSRCYKLLEAVPQWKPRIHELKPLSPQWLRLVENWDELTAMYEKAVTSGKREDGKAMYDYMQQLIAQ